MNYLDFEKLVKDGIKLIPEKFLKMMENVQLCIEDNPNKKQKKELKIRKDEFIFGLYEGVPKTERWGYGFVLPDKITIFKKEIEKYSKSGEEVKKIVKETVWHEIAHHFGMDEDNVERLSKKRKNKKKESR